MQDTIKNIEAKQKPKKLVPLRIRLIRAGLSMKPRTYYLLSCLAGVVGGFIVLVTGSSPLVSLLAAFACGVGLPRWILARMIKRRQAKFLLEFANSIDIIVRGIKSGLAFSDCMQIIARESPEPVRSEFADLIEQQKVGVPLSGAFERMYERMPLQEVNFFAIVIAIQNQIGGNLAEVLSNLAQVLRDRYRVQAKVRAFSAEAKASATIIGALPPLVILAMFFTSPDYISILWHDKLGNIMLIGSAIWMFIGVLVMRKMINFDYYGRAMTSLMRYLLDPQFVVMALAAVAAFATITSFVLPLLSGDRLDSRMKYVAGERERLRAENMARLAEGQYQGKLRTEPKTFMKRVVNQLNLRKALETDATRERLKMAGLRGQAPVVAFLFFRAILPVATFGLTFFYLVFLNAYHLAPLLNLGLSIIGAYVGFYLPNIFISNLIVRRQKSIKRVFPDSLDLLLICVQAGMSVELAMNKVASEIGSRSVELAEEFSLTTAELSYLPERRQAYENLGMRTGIAVVRAVGTSLIQAERYGTAIGQALRVLAKETREMRMAEAEKKAAALGPKLTVPMILFFLPVLFIVIMGPAFIQVMAIRGR